MKFSFEGTVDEFKTVFGSVFRSAPGRKEMPFVSVQTTSAVMDTPVLEDSVLPDLQFPTMSGPKSTFWDEAVEKPKTSDEGVRPTTTLPPIAPELRKEAWEAFKKFCATWIIGFNEPTTDQPDRLTLMQDLGHGRYTIPVLIMAYEIKSLQRLVQLALKEMNEIQYNLDFIDLVACNMVQICHVGYPDLGGTYDYSNAWKRNCPKELK